MGKRHARQPNAPLIYVCAVARFAPRPDIHARIPAILAAMEGYQAQGERVVAMVQFGQSVVHQQQQYHVLLSPNGKSSFLISQDNIFFQTVDVEHYDEPWLREQMAVGISALTNNLPGVVFTFIGNRYVDVIRPRAAESLSQYLNSSLLPLTVASEGPLHRFGLQAYSHKEHILNIRYFAASGRSALPDDLQQTVQELDTSKLNLMISGNDIVVDFDGAWTFKDPDLYSVEEMLERFDAVHLSTSIGFDDAFTPHAHSIWEGTTV